MSSHLELAFRQFHAENPEVYRLFDKFTRQLLAAGRTRYSARAVMHRIRWHTAVETRGDTYKINNNHSPYYARMWMMANPEHDGFFETRASPHSGDDEPFRLPRPGLRDEDGRPAPGV